MDRTHIYLVSYLGGMFGEFLGTQIAKDVNYWDAVRDYSHAGSNRFIYRDVLRGAAGNVFSLSNMPEHTGTSMGFQTPALTRYHQFPEREIEYLDNLLKPKNVITFTHFFWPESTVNLRRVKRVQFVSNPEDVLLPYLMAVLKVWPALPYTPQSDNASPASRLNYIRPRQFIDVHVAAYASRKHPDVYKLVKTIVKDNEWNVPMLNWLMLERNILDLEEWITKSYDAYFARAINVDFYGAENWTILNCCDLIQDPGAHVEEWRDKLDMANVMDVSEIEKYQQNNLALIEKHFGMPYEELKKSDFKKHILNHVQKFDKLKRIKMKAGM